MSCTFAFDGVRYEYGMAFTDARFTEEWLFAWPNGRKQTWFTRGAERDGWHFGPALTGRKALIAELTRDNSLFLSAAAQHNHPELGRIHGFFADRVVRGLGLVDATFAHVPVLVDGGPFTDPRNRDRLVRLLRQADFGVADFKLESREDALRQALGDGRFPADAATRLATLLDERPPHEILLAHVGPDGRREWLDAALESRGTITLINHLGPILEALDSGGLLVVDELDASLHPRMCVELVRMFTDPASNPLGAQLVFTTHDESLLDHLERDEVVLVDKDPEGVARLTPLTDFRTLARDDLRRNYHLGRFGGVPRVGRLSRELEQPTDG